MLSVMIGYSDGCCVMLKNSMFLFVTFFAAAAVIN